MTSTGVCNDCALTSGGVVQLESLNACGTVHAEAMRFCMGQGTRQWFDLYGCDDCGGDDLPPKTPLFIFAHANGGRADGPGTAEIWSRLSRGEDCEPLTYGPGIPKIKLLSWASLPTINRTAQAAEATHDFNTLLEWLSDPEVQDAYGINPNRIFIGGRSRGVFLSWFQANDPQPLLPVAGAYWMNAFATAGWRVSLPHADARPDMPRTHFVYNTDVDGCDGHKPEHGLIVAQMMAKYGNDVTLSYRSDLASGIRRFISYQEPNEALVGCNAAGNFCIYEGIFDSDACGCCGGGDPCADNPLGWDAPLLTPYPDTLLADIEPCGVDETKLLFSWPRMKFPNINPLNGATITIDSLWVRVGRTIADDPVAENGEADYYRFNNQIREIKIIDPEVSHSGQWSSFELPLSALCDAVNGRVLRGRDYGFQFRFAFTMDYDVDFRRGRLVTSVVNAHPILTPWTHATDYAIDYADLATDIPGPVVGGAIQAMPTHPECLCSTVASSQAAPALSGLPSSVEAFPNPVVDELVIQSSESISAIRIYDLSGRLQSTVSYGKTDDLHRSSIDVGTLPPGLYLVEVATRSGREVVKMVK